MILKISLTPQKLMQKRRSTPGDKWRSTPGDKWEVEMEVDTRRKTSVTFSAEFNGGNSAEFNGRTDGRTNERTNGGTNGRNFRRNSAEIPATNRSQEISSTGDIFKITPLNCHSHSTFGNKSNILVNILVQSIRVFTYTGHAGIRSPSAV